MGYARLIQDPADFYKVRVLREHVRQAVANIRRVGPRFVCVIHCKVRDALNRHAGLTREPFVRASCRRKFPLVDTCLRGLPAAEVHQQPHERHGPYDDWA
jgi:hypothetical protein